MPTGMDMHLHTVSIGIKSGCAGALNKDGSMHTAITAVMEKHGTCLVMAGRSWQAQHDWHVMHHKPAVSWYEHFQIHLAALSECDVPSESCYKW